jgi:putative nucleotidyltransferase with HDIG domain
MSTEPLFRKGDMVRVSDQTSFFRNNIGEVLENQRAPEAVLVRLTLFGRHVPVWLDDRILEKYAMNRADAFALLCEHVQDLSLRRHMQSVEAAMRAYARKLGQDEEKRGIVGLLHDFDYERWPDAPDHPLKGSVILKEHGYPDDVIYAIKSHADYLPDCPRVNLMDRALYACDELAGLITAAALVRPGGITDLTAASVKKKMKAKGFARNVKREDIDRGAADFGVELTGHIQFVIDAMKPLAGELGLERGVGGGDEG